jgi:hypothetical protein
VARADRSGSYGNVVDSVQSYMPRDSLNSGGGPPSLDMPRSSGGGGGNGRPSLGDARRPGARGSCGSDASGARPGRASSARSARSSFAMEGGGGGGGEGREPEAASAAALTQLPQLPEAVLLQGSLFMQALPEQLRAFYSQLAVLPAGNPVPLTMLQRLWGLPTYGEAEHVAQALAMRGEPRPGPRAEPPAGAAAGAGLASGPINAPQRPLGAPSAPLRSAPAPAPALAPPAGVLRVAELDDLTVWCLAGPDHVAFLSVAQEAQLPVGGPQAAQGTPALWARAARSTRCLCAPPPRPARRFPPPPPRTLPPSRLPSPPPPAPAQAMHGALLDHYCSSGALRPAELQDDGYILNSLGHHLFWAQRLDELAALLADPRWLELKLHGYGVAAVVADYRRCGPRRRCCARFWRGAALRVALHCAERCAGTLLLGAAARPRASAGPLIPPADAARPPPPPAPSPGRRYLTAREDPLIKALLQALQMSLSCCTQHPTVPMLWSQMLNRSIALAATRAYGMDGWRSEQLARWREQAQRSKGSTVLHLLTRTPSTQQTGARRRPFRACCASAPA